MRILHTSDWHLGHTLHDASRVYEHRCFLAWLLEQLVARDVDALLIAGDIFDTANPSAVSQELWYWFLAQALRARPGLQVVAIAGNHDSAARLEAPDHLLRHFAIRVVGSLPRTPDGAFDPRGVCIPLGRDPKAPDAVVIAMPFLRAGDLPVLEAADPLVAGVGHLYGQAVDAARSAGAPILAMGHAYVVGGQVSELSERRVLGGNQHALPTGLFPEEVVYVALGHLHMPQGLAGGRIRYSGSPLPLAMSERHYPHAVTLLEVERGTLHMEQVRVPRWVPLLRVPETGYLPKEALLEALGALPERTDATSPEPPAFLEVGLQVEKPEASLRAVLDTALKGKDVFLARIALQHTGTGQTLGDVPQIHGLRDLAVEAVFRRRWARDFPGEPAPPLLAALHELMDHVNQESKPARRPRGGSA